VSKYEANILTYEIKSIYFRLNILYLHIGCEVFVTYPSYHAFLKIVTNGDRNLQEVFDVYNKFTYGSFATRVSQHKIWHF